MTAPSNRQPADDPGQRITDLERLLDVARRLGATAELDPLLETIAAAATAVLDCERASVFLLDRAAGELSSRVATGIADSPVKEIRFPIGVGIAGEVARTGTVVNLPDAYADPRFNPEFDRRSGFHTRSMLAVPLADHDGTTVGVLQVLNKRGGSFGPRDEQLAGFLGGQAGVAVQRQLLLAHYAEKQRIERDLAIARDIQQRLLPKDAPVVPGFDIATWYAIWAPPRTPAPLVGRLQQAVAAAVQVPEVREKLATLGAEPVADTPEEFAMFCAREYDRWGRLVRDARVTLD